MYYYVVQKPVSAMANLSDQSRYILDRFSRLRVIQDSSVADTDPFDTDPDPAFQFVTDPDPTFFIRIRILLFNLIRIRVRLSDTDPDPTV